MSKVLVIGSGGREYALAWKLKKSKSVQKVFVAPGNDGMTDVAEIVPDVKVDNFNDITDLVRDEKIDLTVVGPEVPLVNGIVDYWWDNKLVKDGHLIFGPSKAAARLEGSKVFAKQFMHKHEIPTAPYLIMESYSDALHSVEDMGYSYFNTGLPTGLPIVVKADGLAAGKGSIVCKTLDETIAALNRMMVKKEFGSAGDKVVIEDFMEGEEASILALSDGKTIRTLVSSQDHKPVNDGDKGPNTGGMGAYAPAPVVTPEVMKRVYERILIPTIEGMRKEGTPFMGCLYAGLMIDNEGYPRVVEFNVRFGDPETQPVLSLLNSDLYKLLVASATGHLNDCKVTNKQGSACCVVMASGGYPDHYEKGKVISGIDAANALPGVRVFHAGTKFVDGNYVTNGGRVLGVNGTGADIEKAIAAAYGGVSRISWEGEYHRKDIGAKAVGR
jgi:phosphoribosylamine--glycine ligase